MYTLYTAKYIMNFLYIAKNIVYSLYCLVYYVYSLYIAKYIMLVQNLLYTVIGIGYKLLSQED